MFLEKTPIHLVLAICLFTMYGLFSIKENVVMHKAELKQLNKQIQFEKDTIHLLKAEFSYLSSPVRISRLNEKYLKLESTKVAQISDDLFEIEEKSRVIANIDNISKTPVKWRYKKGPSQYVTVSANRK